MTIKQLREAALERQQQIVSASKTAGNAALTADELREFDAQQAVIDSLKSVEPDEGALATERAAAAEAERSRISAISNLCKDFGVEADKYVADANMTIDGVRTAILEHLRSSGKPNSVSVTKDAADKFRAAAADAIAMRAGVSVEKPAEGAHELRSLSLKDLAIESIVSEGGDASGLRRMDSDDLLRQFYNPTSSFPAILDAAIKKSIVERYKKIPTTFETFTSKGTLPDFKESKDSEYVMGSFSEFPEVKENGELVHDSVSTEKLPTRSLKTYGKSFSMTRQAFINDDIGFITAIPGKFAASAKKTIDKQVYSVLHNNTSIYDGKALFHADHNNLISSGAAPSAATIQAAILKGQKQKDPFNSPIYWTPKFLIVGVGYEFDLSVIFGSTQVTGSGNNDINPLYNYPLTVVQSPILNSLAGASACPWFLAADINSCYGIQVDYLNGQETPTITRYQTPGVLGFQWDVFLDWGVTVRDYRGFVKNPGAVIA